MLAALLFRLAFVLDVVFTAATLAALGAFTRAHRGSAVALAGDIRYRPRT